MEALRESLRAALSMAEGALSGNDGIIAVRCGLKMEERPAG
jgi:hypothetical protein